MNLEELKIHLAEYIDDEDYAPFEIGDIRKLLAVAEAAKNLPWGKFRTISNLIPESLQELQNALKELDGL